jgi:hypothetical protein
MQEYFCPHGVLHSMDAGDEGLKHTPHDDYEYLGDGTCDASAGYNRGLKSQVHRDVSTEPVHT